MSHGLLAETGESAKSEAPSTRPSMKVMRVLIVHLQGVVKVW
jgi:hypothetical protein